MTTETRVRECDCSAWVDRCAHLGGGVIRIDRVGRYTILWQVEAGQWTCLVPYDLSDKNAAFDEAVERLLKGGLSK